MNYNKIFMLLISFKLILNQTEKYTTIMNCIKCEMPNVCTQCENGYILKVDLSQCLISNNNINQNAALNSQNNNKSGNDSSNSENNFTENIASNSTNNYSNENASLNFSNNLSNESHLNTAFNLINENTVFKPVLNNSNKKLE